MWKFLACPAPGGGRQLDKFVSALDEEAENNFSALLEDLQVLERKYWTRPQFDVLHGQRYHKMGEIRFDGGGKTYRVFGYFGPTRLHFTLLHGCAKMRSLKHEMDLAAKRRDFAEQHRGLLYEFTFKTEPTGKAEQ